MHAWRRTIIRADKCLLFEPNSPCSRKFLDIVVPRLQDHEAARRVRSARSYRGELDVIFPEEDEQAPPFELEILEAALMVATGGGTRLNKCMPPRVAF
jgi:hypothetical protein